MNPPLHDEFVALCALFVSGELTEEEWALLQVHLAYCDSCRVAFDQYQQIAEDVVPAMAVATLSSTPLPPNQASTFSVETAERALMARLDGRPTVADPAQRAGGGKSKWLLPFYAIAACAAAAIVIGIHSAHTKSQPEQQVSKTTQAVTPPVPTVPSPSSPGMPVKSNPIPEGSADLRRQLSDVQEHYRQSSSTVTSIQSQLQEVRISLEKLSSEKDSLSQQLVAAQAEEQSLRQTLASDSGANKDSALQRAELEAKVRQLTADLQEKDRTLGLDQEFLAHDREIRDLIGARDLYIADIYDVGQNGKTAKSFGRVFYTKDRSLVFYGYDLDQQPGLKQPVQFQAWGRGDDKRAVSLGLFYQDDTRKRWVLRFDDTKTLARLNMVFVTAEPRGGSAKPTGKPLLLAYLQVQPNHP